MAKPANTPAPTQPDAAPEQPVRMRLGMLRTSVPLPSGAFHSEGGDAWLELQPFPHVRVGQRRYGMDKVLTWSLPSDLARKAT